MTTISGVGNLLDALAATQGSSAASASWLRLLPPEYGFLMLLLTHATGCTMMECGMPPARPDGGDGDFDQSSECNVGEQRESYSGPEGTEGVGACRPRIEECVATASGNQYQVIQEEVLPSEEVCDGLDNDCAGPSVVEQWNRTFDHGGYDAIWAVQETSDGGVVAAGCTGDVIGNCDDAWLVRTDGNGVVQWNRTYGGENEDSFTAVQPIDDDGFILAGYTWSFGAYGADGWLIRTDENGEQRWSQHFGSNGFDAFYAVQATDDGGFVMAGSTVIDSYENVGWIIKTNSQGIAQWDRTYVPCEGCEGYFDAMQLTSDGGFIAAGYALDASLVNLHGWLVRTDENGMVQWNQTYGGTHGDYFYAVQNISDGGFIAAGYNSPFGIGSTDGWLVRVDREGVERWSRTFSVGTAPNNNEFFQAVLPTPDGGFMVAGYVSLAGVNLDGLLMRVDEEGVRQWDRTVGTDEEYDYFTSIVPVSGGFVLGGYSSSFGTNGEDGWLIRFCEE